MSNNLSLDFARTNVIDVLTRFASDPSFAEKLSQVFETEVSSNDFLAALKTLPEIEVLSDDQLNGALGAYSKETSKIYLSETLVKGDPKEIELVLFEEIGHYLDSVVNDTDTPGDEGELFAKTVLGEELDIATLQTLRTENDWAVINIGDNQISIEQAVSADPTIPEIKYSDGTVIPIEYRAFTGSLFHTQPGESRAITFRDVAQGALGNCYLMAALAEIAQHNPDAINGIIETISGSTNYSVTIDGTDIEINNNLPVINNPGYTNDGNSIFAEFAFSDGSQSWEEGWVALIEKSYAIVNSQQDLGGPGTYTEGVNSYSTIESGNAARAVLDFVAGTKTTTRINNELSSDDIHSLLSDNTRPTFLNTIGDGKKKNLAGAGLAGNHAYTVIGYQASTQTYRLFNPWNSDGTNSDGVIGRFVDVTIEQIREAGSSIDQVDFSSLNLWNGGGSASVLKAPTDILIYDLPLEFRKADGLSIGQIWAHDPNGWTDLRSVKFWLESPSGTRIDLATVTDFSPYTENNNWGDVNDLFFSESTLNNLSVGSGSYTLKAQAEDQSGLQGNVYSQEINIVGNLAPEALSIFDVPTSVLDNENLVIDQIWAKDLDGWQDIARIDYWMFDPSGRLIELRDSTQFFAWSENNLWAGTNAISFTPSEYATGGTGIYTFRAQVFDRQGQTIEGAESIFSQDIEVLPSNVAPGNVLIYEIPETVANNENLELGQIWAYDPDGWQDIDYIDYWIVSPSGQRIELNNSTSFTPWSENNNWASTTSISFAPNEYALGGDGVYTLKAQAIDVSGVGGSIFEEEITVFTPYDDAYELNNTRQTAYYLGFDQDVWLSNIDGLAVQGDDDWYEIYVESGYERLVVDLQFTHAQGDIDLGVYDANGDLLTSSRGVSDNESIDTVLPNAGTYYLKVFYGDGENSYNLKWNSLRRPTDNNDSFADSILLSGQTTSTTGSNVGFTGQTGEPSQQGTIHSAWWHWTAPSSGSTTIDTNGSDFDTFLSIFTGNAVNSLSLVGNDDDSGDGLDSQVVFNAIAGTTYRIAVDGFASDTGNITLNLNQEDSNTGTPNADTLRGTGQADTLYGYGGNDRLYGYGGNDVLDGGIGHDSMYGGWGDDTYYVDSWSDTVVEYSSAGGTDQVNSTIGYTLGDHLENLTLQNTAYRGDGNSLNNTLYGNSSNNRLRGYGGNDDLRGRGGNDILDGGTGNDSMYGGWGDDTYYVDSWSDTVVEYSSAGGTDQVNSKIGYTLGDHLENLTLEGTAYRGFGNSLNNRIEGNHSDNRLRGYGGDDHLRGRGGNDNIRGDDGLDRVYGGNGADLLFGDNGNDSLYGQSGNDSVYGGVGHDYISGGDGNDQLFGDNGNDSLYGQSGNDSLYGGVGHDYISGGDGNDQLDGWYGNDTLVGGNGADKFRFFSPNNGADVIEDFRWNDEIYLSTEFGGGLTAGSLPSWRFTIGWRASDSGDRIIYRRGSGGLFFDPDGTGSAAQVQFAQLDSGLNLTASDFVVF